MKVSNPELVFNYRRQIVKRLYSIAGLERIQRDIESDDSLDPKSKEELLTLISGRIRAFVDARLEQPL